MLPDPQNITIGALPIFALNRVSGPTNGVTVYQSSDKTLRMEIRQLNPTAQGRLRYKVIWAWRKIVTNPLDSTQDWDEVTSERFLEFPSYGFTQADIEQFITGVKAWETTTVVGRLFGGES